MSLLPTPDQYCELHDYRYWNDQGCIVCNAARIEVTLEEVRKHMEFRAKVNRAKLTDITWTEGGKPVEVDPDELGEFTFTGLNNLDFARTYLLEEEK